MNERELGKRLQAARQQAGLTQQELCQKAGLSISTLAKIERGAIKAPSIFTVSAIAGVVGVPLQELIGSSAPGHIKNDKKSSKTGIRFIYFDVNGVLIRFFHRAFTKIAKDTGAAPDLIETTFWHYNDAVCRGEMGVESFNKELAAQLGVPELKWEEYYFSSVDPINEMHEVVRWASKYYRIGLLTNVMPGFLDQLIKSGSIPDVPYDSIVDSSKVAAIKPEPRIFELAQRQSGVEAKEILLIDDGRTNIMAAEHAGWRVLWFDDYHPDECAQRVRNVLDFD